MDGDQNLYRVRLRASKEVGSGLSLRISTWARLLGQVGTDMNDVVGDHSESDPTSDAVRSFIE